MGGAISGGGGSGRPSANREKDTEKEKEEERTFQVRDSKAAAYGGGNSRTPSMNIV
jgi:hypothetical protein